MRPITSPERALLASAHRNYYSRVEIRDAGTTWRNMGTLLSVDWVDGWDVLWNVDQPVASGSVTLKREVFVSGAMQSVAFLLATSAVNVVGGSYAPLVAPPNLIRISTAVTAAGVAPVTGDWVELVIGKINAVENQADPVVVHFGDLGQFILDAQIEQVKTYGGGGASLETVIQQVLDDNLGATTVSLYTPVASGWTMGAGTVDQVKVLEATKAMALQNRGWTTRYKYDALGVSRFTLYGVDRAPTVPDATFTADEYYDVTNLTMDDADVRNVVRVSFFDSAAGGNPGEAIKEDASSQAVFGRRFMQLAESATSNIDTQAEADAMALAAVTDLSTPPIGQEIDCSFFWPAELSDYYTFTANGVHYSDDQSFGVIQVRHVYASGDLHTFIQTTGKPKGAYTSWLRAQGAGILDDRFAPAPTIGTPLGEATARDGTDTTSYSGAAHLPFTFDAHTDRLEVYSAVSTTPNQPVPERSNGRHVATIRRQDGDYASADAWSSTIMRDAPPDCEVIFLIESYGAPDANGVTRKGIDRVRFCSTVDSGTGPSGAPSGLSVVEDLSGTSPAFTVSCTAPDAAALYRVWRNGIIVKDNVVPASGTATFLDTALVAGTPYTYDMDAVRNGQSTVFASVGGATPPPAPVGGGTTASVAPEWVATYPKAGAIPLVGWISLFQHAVLFRWTCTDPSAAHVEVQASTVPDVGFSPLSVKNVTTGVYAINLPVNSGTTEYAVVVQSGQQRFYRLAAVDGVGAPLGYSVTVPVTG